MTNNKEEASKYHTVQAERDLEANWEVDLSKKLEDYLLKICSGEIAGSEEDTALLLQGSVQVYSRKVEYLYSLVLHALDFLSQKRQQQEQSEGTYFQTKQNDVPVEARNCLDSSTSKDTSFYQFVKPPANLVVLEGDCLDTSGDGGELESYLLATNDLYQDFILLDPCDALAVNDFLKAEGTAKAQNGPYRGSSIRKTFQSPTRHSGGTAHKPSLGKNWDANPIPSPVAGCGFGVNDCKIRPDSPVNDNFDKNPGFDMEDRYSESENAEDSDDNDDPWKPLNPHEPGNLKVKPFKKVKAFRRNGLKSAEKTSVTALFPLARMHGTICPDLAKIWEARQNKIGKHGNTQYPTLFEKLRQSFTNEGHDIPDTFEFRIHERRFSTPPLHGEHDDTTHSDTYKDFGHGDQRSQSSLEDLCRSHLDALLANIAETEKQTELAARISSWKQKIEQNLEEQDSHPPFDIHAYGGRIVGKLSLETDSKKHVMAFTDVVKGQEKHDVARTFSALLQLVNNGEVDLDGIQANTESFCYTAVNPFHVRLVGHKKEQEGRQFQLSKKRVKSPIRKGGPKLGKNGNSRCTPEGKKRRRSRVVEPVDLH
ncbi:hypothetical protein OIU84_018392 [Salix udensis]|uniref:Condensin-2 complex subunit H2 n=1 Tax=Salix udensis TaxID=889485 RepID=A0AAD6KW78_9ROSI|nr:hypothetical protein OIU84_018392 [Salix udensis]